ncbi:MAG TPA: ABC transporter permease [Acidobacteriaceae bacterium]|nr:ABC transporter permease [Acidobacteriaceae bacterium]
MSAMREMLNRWRSFFRKPERDRELDAEIAGHLELAVEENMRRGMAAGEARRQALIRFGGVAQARERQREARGLPWPDELLQDLRYTVRTLRRDRGFALIAVFILALGIGANITVFSVVHTILLRPLPFHDPERLVRILSKAAGGGESSMTYSADATEAFQRRNRSFASVTGYYAFSSSDNLKLMGRGQPLPVTGVMVAGNFFATLGVKPLLGRLFLPADCVHGSRPAALLSHGFWKRQFAADPGIVGRPVDFNGIAVTVIGVLPESFDFGSVFSPGAKADLFWPVIFDDIRDEGNAVALVGRLKPGVSLAQAQAEADLLFPGLPFALKHPNWSGDYTGRLLGLKDYVSGKWRRSLLVLWCAVGLILLIVCVNLSNLLLARTAARGKEFAMRRALGARRRRLVRQLLTESLVLSGAGAMLGLGLAFAAAAYLAHQGAIALPLLSSVRIDGAALLWTLLVAGIAAVLFGLAPGLKVSSSDLQEALKDGAGHGASAGRRHERMRSALTVAEIALACMLLVGAGLLLRSFLRLLDVDLGFQPSHAATVRVDYDDGGDAAKRMAIWQEILRRVEAIPGIETAGISDNLPMSRNRSWPISAKGKEYRKGELQATFVYIISPGYLHAIGMRLIQGRDLLWSDGPKAAKVVIVNQTVARRLWPGEDPIGRIARVSGSDAQVIGVVADVRESSVEGDPGWQMYLPAAQWGAEGAQLVVRTRLPPETMASRVMNELRQMNPAQPATEFRPVQQLVDHVLSPRRFFVLLVSLFAALGLILASLGIYGVISYSVTQQTQAIGIRMALGATQARVRLAVIAQTLRLALAGIAVGALASLGVATLIASLLFATPATDPPTFLAMFLVLGAVALLAGYLPARRASRIDPMIALRSE